MRICKRLYFVLLDMRSQYGILKHIGARKPLDNPHNHAKPNAVLYTDLPRLQVHCDDLEDALAELSKACNGKASAVKGLEKECQRLANQVMRLQGGRPPPTDEEELLRSVHGRRLAGAMMFCCLGSCVVTFDTSRFAEHVNLCLQS